MGGLTWQNNWANKWYSISFHLISCFEEYSPGITVNCEFILWGLHGALECCWFELGVRARAILQWATCSSAVVILEPYPSSKQQLWMVIDMMSCELIVCKGTTTTHVDHFSQVDYATKEITPTWITNSSQCSGVHNLTCLRWKISTFPISAHCRLVQDMTRIMTF